MGPLKLATKFVHNKISLSINCRDGDIVLVDGDLYKDFRDKILPQIRHKVILVSTLYADPKVNYMLDILKNNNVIHWFAKNVHIDHPRVTPLPIGVTNFMASIFGQKNNFRLQMFCWS